MLYYIEHALYRLERTKKTFEQQRPINFKLCQTTFNYPKFYIINYYVKYILDDSSAINYDITYSKAAHKYLLKAFCKRINKKNYKLQIWQNNIWHTYIIVRKNVIIEEKTREK